MVDYTDGREISQAANWILWLGILISIVGLAAIWFSVSATLVTVVFLSFILILGGLAQCVSAFQVRRWQSLLGHLLTGLLYLIFGGFLLARPGESALVLTLIMAAFFIASGAFKSILSVIYRSHHWGWILFNGLISIILGVMIWNSWPVSGLFMIGLFVGIDLFISGATLASLGATIRNTTARLTPMAP